MLCVLSLHLHNVLFLFVEDLNWAPLGLNHLSIKLLTLTVVFFICLQHKHILLHRSSSSVCAWQYGPLCFLQVTDTIKKQSWKSEIIRSDKRCVYTGQRHRILLAFERFRCDTGDIGRKCRGHDSVNRRSHSKCRRLKKETVFLRNKARSSTIRRGIKDSHRERYITINVSQICFSCCGTVCLKHPRASRDHTWQMKANRAGGRERKKAGRAILE